MNHHHLIDSLDRFRTIFPAVVSGVHDAEARWKPSDKDWSILEICCHLADEEELDFRVRLRSTIENPAQAWPAIDPGGWPALRRYNEQNLHDTVQRFVCERQASLDWLASLRKVDWSSAHAHPKIGPIRAGDLLAAWAAHDALHLRQIAKRFFQLTQRDAGEFRTRYAGEW